MNTKILKAGITLACSLFPLQVVVAAETVQTAEVVVTATRTAQTVDETLASVTIITREDIERQQPRDIRDLFQNVPGVAIINNGGMGKTTTFSIRGSETKHVLVLVDGVRVGSATKGLTAYQHISPSQIERIEIVRGPRAHLYGSGAISGVIQIFTRRSTEEGTRVYGSIGYGSNNTKEADAGMSASVGETDLSVNLGKQKTKGFDAKTKGSDDKDGYYQKYISGNLSHSFENGLNLELIGSATSSLNQYDGTTSTSLYETDSEQTLIGIKATKDITDIWDVEFNAARSWDLVDSLKDDIISSEFNTARTSLAVQNNFEINETNMIVAGSDYIKDKVSGSTAYSITSRQNIGLFGQYLGEFGKHSLQTSLRFDDNEQFGGHATGGAAWGYQVLENVNVFASYGTAFQAPTFNELYYPVIGAADLSPETSKTWEIGLRGHEKNGNWEVNAFQTDVKNLITYTSSTTPYENLSTARMRGVEIAGDIRLGAWDLAANISHVIAENRSQGTNFGKRLYRRPAWRGNLNIGYQINDEIRLGGDLHHVGHSYDTASNSREIKPWTTVDLRADYQFAPNLKLEFSANNVFDRVYKTASYYNQDTRNFFLRLRYDGEYK